MSSFLTGLFCFLLRQKMGWPSVQRSKETRGDCRRSQERSDSVGETVASSPAACHPLTRGNKWHDGFCNWTSFRLPCQHSWLSRRPTETGDSIIFERVHFLRVWTYIRSPSGKFSSKGQTNKNLSIPYLPVHLCPPPFLLCSSSCPMGALLLPLQSLQLFPSSTPHRRLFSSYSLTISSYVLCPMSLIMSLRMDSLRESCHFHYFHSCVTSYLPLSCDIEWTLLSHHISSLLWLLCCLCRYDIADHWGTRLPTLFCPRHSSKYMPSKYRSQQEGNMEVVWIRIRRKVFRWRSYGMFWLDRSISLVLYRRWKLHCLLDRKQKKRISKYP